MILYPHTAIGADLVVMGAYGHSRFRELVLGGVTRHLLQHLGLEVERGPALSESCGKAAVDSTIFVPRLTETSLEDLHA